MAARRKIAENWYVNEDGDVYYHHRRQPVTNLIAYAPTVDLRGKYLGPVPSHGCADDCPLCRWNRDTHDIPRSKTVAVALSKAKVKPPVHRPGTLRLLADVVCYAFHKRPDDFRWSTHYAAHLDGKAWKPGNVQNCAADNLEWREVDKKTAEELYYMEFQRQHGLPRITTLQQRIGA